MRSRKQAGFSLVTAIFLLVAVAALVASMVNLGSVQHATVAMSVRGALAMEAARSAMDYAVFQVLNGDCGNVANFTFTAAEPELQPYNVQIDCGVTQHSESTNPAETFDVYTLTVTASAGTYASGSGASPDYVSRRLRATVSQEPP